MRRRVFLKVFIGGAAYGLAACVPAPRRDARGSRVTGEDAAAEPPSSDSPDVGPPDPPAHDASVPEEPAQRDAATNPDASAPEPAEDAATAPDAAELAPDGGTPPDSGECTQLTRMHDTYAQALYFDGTYGPLTGTITVAQVLANVEVDMEFWHGHGGVSHHFLIGPEHFASLKRGERVTLETTEVDSHRHLLFVDPVDPNYRVPGAPDIDVPSC